MFTHQQPQRRQVEHLPGLDPHHHRTGQLSAAPLAAVRHMPDHLVGLCDLGQMGAGRAKLLARHAAALGLLGTALLGPRGLSKTIRGWRLGGVGGVGAQAALQLRHLGLQRSNRPGLRGVDRAQLGDDRGLDGDGGLQVHNVRGNRGLRQPAGLRPACHGPHRKSYTAVIRPVKLPGTCREPEQLRPSDLGQWPPPGR
jgi:hypothetical protein